MKKNFSFILLCLLSICMFSSCSTKKANDVQFFDNDSKLKIVSTIFPYYDFAKQMTGDKADVKMLLSPGSEPHDFEPTPSDIISINNADIFIYNGGESDEWVESILDSIDSHITVVKMMDYINPVHEQTIDKEEEDEYDEHIWTSPANAVKMATALKEQFKASDEKNAQYYEEQGSQYIENLQTLDSNFTETVKNGNRNSVVFGDRFPFLYFVKEFNLDYECAFPGCSSETEPSVATVTHLINFVRDENIPVVFYLDFSNQAVANLLCEDSSAKKLLFHDCHSITADEFYGGATYISLMEENVQALKEALK